LTSISIETGNDIFVIEKDILIGILHSKLIQNFSQSSRSEFGRDIEVLGSHCFASCKSLSSITFESNSRLTRIVSFAFSLSLLQSISIPSNVEILGSNCLSCCHSLSSITFESNSRLTRIESFAFPFSPLQSILLPSTILFVASEVVNIYAPPVLVDGDFCPEFDRWVRLRRSNIRIDFRRIQRVNSGFSCLSDYVVHLSGFEERPMICESNQISPEIYGRCEDELLVVVKSIELFESFDKSRIVQEIENLINLRHPCIAGPISFAFPIESYGRQSLKIVRLYFEGCSLAEVLSACPLWLTSTMKAKIVAGII
jgi:predicted metal-binding protein